MTPTSILNSTPSTRAITPPIKAMILAAGRGERMRPLTDNTPKPLLKVRGKPLMQWSMEALVRGGFAELVVNTAWLGAQIEAQFSDVFELPPAFNPSELPRDALIKTSSLTIRYSHEGQDFGSALETAGGIARALPLLCSADNTSQSEDVFWVLAGDVFAPDFVFSQAAVDRFIASDKLAHLWLVPNPAHNLKGDFGLSKATGLALNLAPDDPQPRYTYSTLGLYRRALFEPPYSDIPAGNPQGIKAPLAPLLRRAMDNGRVSAELYLGSWTDVGTPERLQQLNASIAALPNLIRHP